MARPQKSFWKKLKRTRKSLQKTASLTERTAQEMEREVEKMKKAQYMQSKVGEIYEGIISGVTTSAFTYSCRIP